MFKIQESAGNLGKLQDLVDTDFGGAGTASGGWGRSADDPTSGVDMCWDKDGSMKPMAFEDMNDDEREVGLSMSTLRA